MALNHRFNSFRNRLHRKQERPAKNSRDWFDYASLSSTLVLGIAALSASFYTCNLQQQGNKVSEAAYMLAKNDTSQQKQIDQLTAILVTIRDQNKIEEVQRDELLKITRHGNNQDSLSNRILGRMERQVGLTNQQLRFAAKEDSIMAYQKLTSDRGHVLALQATFDEIGANNVNLLNNVVGISKLTHEQRLNVIAFIKKKLEEQLENPVFLTDKLVRAIWLKYYLQRVVLLKAEGMFDLG